MREVLGVMVKDWQEIVEAVKISQKNPFFIFVPLVWIFVFLIYLLFLTALGRKIYRQFKISLTLAEELLFSLGLGIIFWGTLVLILGLLGILSCRLLWFVTGVSFLLLTSEAVRVLCELRELRVRRPKRKFEKVLKMIFLVLVIFNFLGALTPEKGVDALGYHLYFPKVYLQNQTMMLPARGSRLFSLFPHLASMIYLLPVSLSMPNVAQLTHMWLGVLTAVTIGLITGSTTVSLVFYSTILVGSISRSAYADFFVTFFLTLGFLGLDGVFGKDREGGGKRLILAGLMFGGTLATKNQSLALIPILFFWFSLKKKAWGDFLRLAHFIFFVPFFWYLRSFILSGNPVYPMFSLKDVRIPQLDVNYYLNFEFLKYLKVIVLYQPIFIFVLLFVLFSKKKGLRKKFLLGILIFLYWLFLPTSFHDNRYFLPYFILIILSFSPILERIIKEKWGILGILGVFGVLVLPRIYTNSFYLPYIFGLEEKKIYLSNALRTRPEDFYDIDGMFSQEFLRGMKELGKVKILTDNILGLYYLGYPFSEFEYSEFYRKKMSESKFKKEWIKGNYSFLLLKNETLNDFFAKMGINLGDGLFRLAVAHAPSKTYLFKPDFK